jgi:transcriptional regulator with XRE-family HTH domain
MRPFLFNDSGMSPSSPHRPPTDAALRATKHLLVVVGERIRQERMRRRWTLRELGRRAQLSPATVQSMEAGNAGSFDAAIRLSDALGLRLEIELMDPRRRQPAQARVADPVHSAMGEIEAAHFRRLEYRVAIDEPYQHYQFAGRADLVAWDVDSRALLHLENRTRFPDVQDMAGAYNAKRAYFGRVFAERLGGFKVGRAKRTSW